MGADMGEKTWEQNLQNGIEHQWVYKMMGTNVQMSQYGITSVSRALGQ